MSDIFLKLFSNDRDPSNAENNQKMNKILIFIGLFVAMAVLLMMVSDEKKEDKRDVGSFKIVEEDTMAKTRWVGDAAVDMKIAKKQVDSLNKENDKLSKELADLKKMIVDMKTQQDKNIKAAEQPQTQKDNQPFPFGDSSKGLYTNYPKPNDGSTTGTLGISQLGDVPDIQKQSVTKYTRIDGALEYTQVAKPTEVEKKSKPKDKTIISTGSITKAVLLSGMDAPTMTQAKTSPLPVLMKVTDLSILPNRWQYDIKECFLVGEGYGDLTAERAYIRTNNISCVTNKGKYIDMPFKGAATGEDGKLGLKGEVVTKQGALLARTLIAGFLQGVGDAFSQQNQVVLTGTTGVTTTTKDLTAGQAMEMGAFSGLSKSAEKLADFYLKMADQVAPVIEISAGREINIITTQMVELKSIEEMENAGNTNQGDKK
ncbi:conjugal transfer protein TraB (plasmid) [Campylobacter iguaniorum]|uniref:Conjugal transfer protein TraB n=1 Tax=Campylobacter iguaniorum TaxID=1244531 RepID=A0A076FDZ4_9BACT|nr:TraB/VirB10 family protein [Campylobacter iguaniorum]AII15632.1 conjugal transfer protein TraB [Campylobacter iguaniorum]